MIISDLILRVEYSGSTYDLPVDNDVALRIDMSTVESQQLGKFFGIGSQTFSLPGTKLVNRFFNHAYDVAQDEVPAMYNTLPCSVILNGETLLIGSLQLLSVVASDDGFVTYNVQVVDKVLQFEESLASKLIRDADWSAYDHVLSSGSIVDSWDGTLLGGAVYYPVVDYGRTQNDSYVSAPVVELKPGSATATDTENQDNNGTWSSWSTPANARQFLPAIRVKDTLDVIFEQVGFNYTGSFTETEDFNNLYILNKPKKELGVITPADSSPLVDVQKNTNQSYAADTEAQVLFQNELLDPLNAFNTGTSEYTTPEQGTYTFQSQIQFYNPSSGAARPSVVTLELQWWNGASWTVLEEDARFYSSTLGIGPYFQTVTTEVNFAAGARLRAYVKFEQIGGGTPPSLTLLPFSTWFKCTEAPETYESINVDMSLQWEAKTKSIDVLKGLLAQFNLVMIPQLGNKTTVEIYQFDEWMRAGQIKDWTSKYDKAKRIEIEHTVSDLPKETFLQNAEDKDRFSVATIDSDPTFQYGTLRLLADNTVSQGTKKVGDYFAPIILGSQVNWVYPATITKPFEGTYDIDLTSGFIFPHLYKLNNNFQESYTPKSRIGYKATVGIPTGRAMYVGKPSGFSAHDPNDSIKVTDTYATISNLSSLPAITGISKDLHFNNTYPPFSNAAFNFNGGVDAYANYWRTYLDSLYWEGSKKVTMDLFFQPYEYQTINLNDRIVIKGQAYRINKIKGFNITHRDVVTAELIKLYPKYWQVEDTEVCVEGCELEITVENDIGPVPSPVTPSPSPTPVTPTPTPTPVAPTPTPTPSPATPSPIIIEPEP